MKIVVKVVRILLGLNFLVFGLNGFFQFIPMEGPSSPNAQAYMSGLIASGYFFPVLKITEVLASICLLFNQFVPLALILLAPITVHILLYHLFLVPEAILFALFLVGANAFLGFYAYRSSYSTVLSRNVNPDAQ